ncbi:MAG: UDP-N-acetylmuramate dehydrogenase [Candidatus Omnitrophota bacterium]
MTWWKGLRGKIKFKEPLNKHTTFKIGGPAGFFVEPYDAADLKLLIASAKRYKIRILTLGLGSNILISDKGIRGIVLRLSSPFFKKVFIRANYLEAGSAVTLNRIVQAACQRGFSGVEFLAGIPGTLGGALVMNAGAWGRNIGELVEEVTVMDRNGNIKLLRKKDIKFKYRSSSLAAYIILSARIKLAKGNKEKISSGIKKYLECRRDTQDVSFPGAGCAFKNPPGQSAGRLIDLCGLKGKKVGGAGISMRHANFILNCNRASARDVIKLMGLIRKTVKHKFNINLEPEIKIWK